MVIAAQGSVAKITGKEGLFFEGPAKVFNSEFEANEGIKNGFVKKGMLLLLDMRVQKVVLECLKC